MPATRRFRHACNQKHLVEHTECFHVTHNYKKQLVKNVVSTSLEVVNKVQENLSLGNFQDKVVSFIPKCITKEENNNFKGINHPPKKFKSLTFYQTTNCNHTGS